MEVVINETSKRIAKAIELLKQKNVTYEQMDDIIEKAVGLLEEALERMVKNISS